MDWSEYAPGLQARIDDLADEGDCSGLQAEFDNADANNSVELMEYIDAQLEASGCY